MKKYLIILITICMLGYANSYEVSPYSKEGVKSILTNSTYENGYYYINNHQFLKNPTDATQKYPETEYFVIAILDSLGYSLDSSLELGGDMAEFDRFKNEILPTTSQPGLYYCSDDGGFSQGGVTPNLRDTYYNLILLDLLGIESRLSSSDYKTDNSKAEETVNYLNTISTSDIEEKYQKFLSALIVNEISSKDVSISSSSLKGYITEYQSTSSGIYDDTTGGFTPNIETSVAQIESTYYAVYLLSQIDPYEIKDLENSDKSISDFIANLQISNENSADLGGFVKSSSEYYTNLRYTYYALATLQILTDTINVYEEDESGEYIFEKIDKKAATKYILNKGINQDINYIENLYYKTKALEYLSDQVILSKIQATMYDEQNIPTAIIGDVFNITVEVVDIYNQPIEDATLEMLYTKDVTYISKGIEINSGEYVFSVDSRFLEINTFDFEIDIYKDGYDTFKYTENEGSSLSTSKCWNIHQFRIIERAVVADHSVYPKEPTDNDKIKISLFLVDTDNAPLTDQTVVIVITKPDSNTQNILISEIMDEEANGFYTKEVSLDPGTYDVYLITETNHTTVTFHRTIEVKDYTKTYVTADWFLMTIGIVGVFGTTQIYQNRKIIGKRVTNREFWSKVGPSLISWGFTVTLTGLFIYLVGILAAITVSGYMTFALFTWWYCNNYRDQIVPHIKDTLIKWSGVMLVMRGMIALLSNPDQSFTGPMGPAPIGSTPALMYLSIMWALMIILIPAKSCSYFYDLIGRKRVPKAEKVVSKLMGRNMK